MSRATGFARVGNEVDRIGRAGVFRIARVVEIELARVGSITTFSSTVPKRSVVAKISGSASRDSLMTLA